MRSSRSTIIAIILVIVASSSTKNSSASSDTLNATQTVLDDTEELTSLEDETPFRERYRRLIPYMTYYVSNNYVNPQSLQPTTHYNNKGRIQPGAIQRRPTQYFGGRINNNVLNNKNINIPNNYNNNNNNNNNNNGKKYNNYYVSPPIQREKFIPSVQYDPTDMDNEEYFIPVRYNANVNPDDYQSNVYQGYRTPLRQLETKTEANNFRIENNKQQFVTTRIPTTTSTMINFTPGYDDIFLVKDPLIELQKTRPDYKMANFAGQRTTSKPFKYSQGNPSNAEFEPLQFSRPQPFRPSEQSTPQRPRNQNANLNHIVKSLQLTNQLPETLNANNIDSSIKTLVEILNILNEGRKYELPNNRNNYLPVNPVTPKYEENYNKYEIHQVTRPQKITTTTKRPFKLSARPIIVKDEILEENQGPYRVELIDVLSRKYLPAKVVPASISQDVENEDIKQFEKPINVESTTSHDFKTNQEQEDLALISPSTTTEEPAQNYPPPDGVSSHTQNFPPTSVKYGATRGKPNFDYPAYATIPMTDFSCTDQRYKGFFGDPQTGCQVWHYCDLNGGMSSFLCPNGTIFSQVALTCDWWFNVKCESTTQLYVLNERLYKYILPVMPKFPEDFSGPEVDRYLELKFKEMEAKMREKKLKKQQEKANKMKSDNTQLGNNSK